MLLFYHGIGVLIMFIGTFIIENVVPEYEEPSIPLSIISVVSAGPIEEILFFGIPFYVLGNHLVVLATGLVWVMLHILNTNTLEISSLAYLNWLFVIPSLFFSLRTWISGKGWFAIITHSAWNAIFFTLGCLAGEISCVLNLDGDDVAASINSLVISAILIGFIYILYKRKASSRREKQRREFFV
jgi:hypothetical protein